MRKEVLYLASDVFDKGGIQRYSRAQIDVIRDHIGPEKVAVLSLWPPIEEGFEQGYEVDFYCWGNSLWDKMAYAAAHIWFFIKLRPKIVWTNHIRLLPLAYFSKLIFPMTQVVLNVYGLEIWSGLGIFEKICLNRDIQIISDSHFTARYVKLEFGIDRENISVIWDPVDTERFVPRKNSASSLMRRYGIPEGEDQFLLMTLGRISVGSRHKGYDRLLGIMADLKKENISLVIGGAGNDLARLERRVIDEGLKNCVFFTGAIPEKDLVDVYNLADLFVLVSERGKGKGEGVPLTPLEAASCGVPIIVGNDDGSQEAVIQGENGYVVSPGDEEDLKRRILFLQNNSSIRNEMGRKAREFVIKNFSLGAFKNKHEKLLNDLTPPD